MANGVLQASVVPVSIVVPAWNEAAEIGKVLRTLRSLYPQPREIVVAVGPSSDTTAAQALRAGCVVVKGCKGRAAQLNAGARACTGEQVVFLHADTLPPTDLVQLVNTTLSQPGIVCGGFLPLIVTGTTTYWFMTMHNILKTYYGPALLRPWSYWNGLRILFGDQCMFVRSIDFWSVRGFDTTLPVLEDADLCLKSPNEWAPVPKLEQ
mmetsp:Transcript_18245/g.61986  ORF Transcript_18245/g.61986 Transcript_18245/m.61986 type:complete len:208 (+) Transcript_18245:326-949(+)